MHINTAAVTKEMLLWTGPQKAVHSTSSSHCGVNQQTAVNGDCRLELGRGLTQQTPVNGDCGLELGKGIPDTWGIVDSEPEAMGICDLGEIIGQLELTYQSLDWTAN